MNIDSSECRSCAHYANEIAYLKQRLHRVAALTQGHPWINTSELRAALGIDATLHRCDQCLSMAADCPQTCPQAVAS